MSRPVALAGARRGFSVVVQLTVLVCVTVILVALLARADDLRGVGLKPISSTET